MTTLNNPTIAAFFRLRIPQKQDESTQGALATQREQFFINFPGKWLDVQPGYCALVKYPDGTLVNLRAGSHYLKGNAAPYTIQFYDLSLQISILQELGADSSDGWGITVSKMETQWRIDDPRLLVNIPHYRNVVESQCRKVVIDYIRRTRYDQLVSIPGHTPLATAEIADHIKTALLAGNSLRGFGITDVLILGIRGDQRRTEREMMAQHEQAKLNAARLAWEKNYLDQSQALALKEAETKRLVAEDAERIRQAKAEITAAEARILRESEVQAMELRQFVERQRMDHEERLKAIEIQGQALGQIASALLQATTFSNGGLQRGIDGGNLDGIAQALGAFASRMPAVSLNSEPVLPALEFRKPASLRERIIEELYEVQKLSGTEGVGLREIRPGIFQAEIIHLNLRIFIICDEHYPIAAPEKIEARWTKDINYKSMQVQWTEGMKLVNIVQQVAAKFHSSTFMDSVPGNGSGAKKAQKVVVE